MFTSIELKGYGPFRDVRLDLLGRNDRPMNRALIYGENGSGKTVLAESVGFLKRSVGTLSGSRTVLDDSNPFQFGTICIDGGAEAGEDLRSLARGLVLRGAGNGIRTGYAFRLGDNQMEYSMEFDEDGLLIGESLHGRINGRRARLYSAETGDGTTLNLNPRAFPDNGYREALKGLAARYFGSHSVLSIIHRDLVDSPEGSMDGSLDIGIREALAWIDSISVRTASMEMVTGPFAVLRDGLERGRVPESQEHVLDVVGEALEKFMLRLYSNLYGIRYDKVRYRGWTEYHLHVTRKVAGQKTEFPVEEESSGIRRFISFFPQIMTSVGGGVAVVDEMDSGVHELFIRGFLSELEPAIGGQFIMTAHNTSLMEDFDPRGVFIIRIDYLGEHSMSSIRDMARTQRTNNNRDRYVRGMFDGIPYLGSLDMDEIREGMVEALAGVRERTRS